MPKQAKKPLTDKQTRAEVDRSKFRGLRQFKDMTDDEFIFVATMAHERDITFNQMIGHIIQEHINTLEEKESG